MLEKGFILRLPLFFSRLGIYARSFLLPLPNILLEAGLRRWELWNIPHQPWSPSRTRICTVLLNCLRSRLRGKVVHLLKQLDEDLARLVVRDILKIPFAFSATPSRRSLPAALRHPRKRADGGMYVGGLHICEPVSSSACNESAQL